MRRRRTKFSHHGDLATGICAPSFRPIFPIGVTHFLTRSYRTCSSSCWALYYYITI